MGKTLRLAMLFFLLSLMKQTVYSEGFFGVRGGGLFPSVMRNTGAVGERAIWQIGMDWCGMTQTGFAIAGSFDFGFQGSTHGSNFDKSHSEFGNIQEYTVEREVRRFLFHPALNISLDIAQILPIHPVIFGAWGPMMLHYVNREYHDTSFSIFDGNIDDDPELTKHSGVYWGFTGQIGAALHVELGNNTTFYGGVSYLIGSATNRKWRTNTRYRQDLSGPSFRLGFRFL